MGRKTKSVRANRQKQRPQQPMSSIKAAIAIEPIQMRSRSLKILLKKQKRGQKKNLKTKKLLRAFKLKKKKRKRHGYSHLPLMQMRCMTPGWILLRKF